MGLPAKRLIVAAILVVVAAVVVAALYRVALLKLREETLAALGPGASIGAIDLSLRAVEISDLSLKAPAGWPAASAFSVERVRIVPRLATLFSGTVRVARVELRAPDLTVWRSPNGKWRALPAFTERRTPAAGAAGGDAAERRQVVIEHIVVERGKVTVHDSAVSATPHQIAFRQVQASIKDLAVPGLDRATAIELTAQAGNQATLNVRGSMRFANLDGRLAIEVRRGALAAVEPYLLKAAETGVRRGEFDLDLGLTIASRRIVAPGRVSLRGLELKPSAGGTFMGLPREALVERLKDHEGRIDVPFRIEGNLDDANFSLGAAFKARLALAAADVLGLKAVIGELARRSGVGDKVDQAVDAVKRWLKR